MLFSRLHPGVLLVLMRGHHESLLRGNPSCVICVCFYGLTFCETISVRMCLSYARFDSHRFT